MTESTNGEKHANPGPKPQETRRKECPTCVNVGRGCPDSIKMVSRLKRAGFLTSGFSGVCLIPDFLIPFLPRQVGTARRRQVHHRARCRRKLQSGSCCRFVRALLCQRCVVSILLGAIRKAGILVREIDDASQYPAKPECNV